MSRDLYLKEVFFFSQENKQLMHRQEATQTSIFKRFLLTWEDRGFAVQVDEYFLNLAMHFYQSLERSYKENGPLLFLA